jgi:hypothetical protein
MLAVDLRLAMLSSENRSPASPPAAPAPRWATALVLRHTDDRVSNRHVYNYKLRKESAELAKRSQKLLCSPAVDLTRPIFAVRVAKRTISDERRQHSVW